MTDQKWYRSDENELFSADMQQRAEELENIPDASPDQDDYIQFAVLPLRDMIVLPGTVSPLYIGRDATLTAIDKAHANNKTMLALAQRDPAEESPGVDSFLPIGVELAVGKLVKLPNDNQAALVQGRRRIEVIEVVQDDGYLSARGRIVDQSIGDDVQFEGLTRTVLHLFEHFVSLAHNLPEETHEYITNSEPNRLADLIVSSFTVPLEELHILLAEPDPYKRLQRAHTLLRREVEVVAVENEINAKVHKKAEREQRETYLREQLKTIQAELGVRPVDAGIG